MNASLRTGFYTFFSLFLGITFATAQSHQLDIRPATIDPFITRVMDSANVPGLSIAIIQKGKLAYSQGYGLTKADSTQRVTSATIFDAASLSKPVFAYAVLQLVEEGLLNLDKPLYEYLPYPDVANDERYKQITARMVLSHRSGFPNWRRNRSSNQLTISFDPGTRFSYSGEGFVYLQKVVEKLTGKLLNDFMTERVFKPLQMTRSGYVWQPAFDANFAFPHTSLGKPESKGKSDQGNSAYSLQTTADDYAKFLLALLEPKGLRSTTIDQMLSPQSRLPQKLFGEDTLAPTLRWGLGFGLELTPTGNYFWHWGDNGTYKCYITANRKDKNAVVYFTNSFNGLGIAETITKHILGGDHPAIAFLGYSAYNSSSSVFARYVLSKGVATAIKPYLDSKGKSTLPENQLNRIGYQLIQLGRAEDALEALKLNMEAYPASANVYDSYGYANLSLGKVNEAITYYTKALALKPDNTQAKQILTGLAAAESARGATKLILTGYPHARLVTLAGSFNDWNNLHTFFVKKGDTWECPIDVKPGTYTYKIVVDGKWIVDPANPATQKDEQGNVNSVLVVN